MDLPRGKINHPMRKQAANLVGRDESWGPGIGESSRGARSQWGTVCPFCHDGPVFRVLQVTGP